MLAAMLAGTGRRIHRHYNSLDLMAQRKEEKQITIETAEGWAFAYEGGAHILFRHTTKDQRFKGKLLRLAKRNKHTLPVLKKYQSVLDTFLPLLSPNNREELVVQTELLKVRPKVLEQLQSSQVKKNTKRESILELEETHGTLLEDLNADPTILLFDFKPKWLSPSPTAPWNANTCRTCALRRFRNKPLRSDPRFCPLDLASGRESRVLRAVTALLIEKSINYSGLAAQITSHLLKSKLIPTLLKAQTCPRSSLATKMTLRDCTLFVQIPRELISDMSEAASGSPIAGENMCYTASQSIPNGDLESPNIPNGYYKPKSDRQIRIVISDLDEKSEAIRGDYWKSIEDNLIKGGYYHGKGKLDSNEPDCDFTDVVWTSDQVKWSGCSI